MAGRRCPRPSCPRIITDGSRYCPAHAREYEAKRGSTSARGYGSAHQRLRAAWQARIDRGEVVHCARCGQRIDAGMDWALDHNADRTGYLGPSHTACNNSAGGRAAHKQMTPRS